MAKEIRNIYEKTKIITRIKDILITESEAVKEQLKHIDSNFISAIDIILNCSGKIVIIGIGKSGIIGRKISATFVSLGIQSISVLPGDLTHGDIGIILPEDVIMLISYSGESEELKKILPYLKKLNLKIIIMTGRPHSTIAKSCDCVINTAVKKEACHFNLIPTSSTTATLAVGDALALIVAEIKGLKKEDYFKYHPGGTIGKKLTLTVDKLMRKGKDNPVIDKNCTVREALIVMTKTKLGATSIVDSNKHLVGYFTDGDLRRKLQTDPKLLDRKICNIMTKNPKTITGDKLAIEAGKLMKKYNCDNLPVVDEKNHVIGIIDERDLILAGIL